MPEWDPVYTVIALLAIALVFGVGEALTPFFGMALISGVALIAAIWVGFNAGPTLGWWTTAAVAAGVPLFFLVLFKALPRTSLGRSLMPPSPDAGVGDAFADLRFLESLRGRAGKAVTMLRPVGAVEFDGRRVECQAEGGFIAAGTGVQVLEVQGSRVVVRPLASNG
jgi:membrane-bound serine protease (ClpP class)